MNKYKFFGPQFLHVFIREMELWTAIPWSLPFGGLAAIWKTEDTCMKPERKEQSTIKCSLVGYRVQKINKDVYNSDNGKDLGRHF